MLLAGTPFNLENLKDVNILIMIEKKLMSAKEKAKLKKELVAKLHDIGIKSVSQRTSTLAIKVQSQKKDKTYFISIDLIVGEVVKVKRSSDIETFAMTYSKNDFIESEEPSSDIYESVIEFLLVEFIEQYKEENESL